MKSFKFAATFLVVFIGCSYVAGKGDAEQYAKDFIATNLKMAKSVTHTCQTRDTNGDGYVNCTLVVDWGVPDSQPEIMPIACSVNRAGVGCGNEGCTATMPVRLGPQRTR